MKRGCSVPLVVIFLLTNTFLLSGSTVVRAQKDDFLPGYAVTAKNDTLKGFILIKDQMFNAGSCVFAESLSGPQKNYTPEDINAYGVDGKAFYYSHAVTIDGRMHKLFLECLVKGKISLFAFQDRYFLKTETKVEELMSSNSTVTKGDQVYKVNLPVYKGILQTAMNDCGTIHNHIKETAFTKKDLTRLVMSYHKCMGLDAVTFEPQSAKGGIRFGLSLGVLSSSLSVKSGDHPSLYYLDNNKAMTDFSVMPALWVEFLSKSKFSFRTGLTYYNSEYTSYDEDAATNLDHELIIKTSRIEMPLQVRFRPKKDNAGLYFTGGVGLNATLKWDDREITKVHSTGYVLSDGPVLENNDFFTNVLVGAGWDIKLAKRTFFLEGRYGWSQSVLSSSKVPEGTLNAITFSAGILF